MHRDMTGAPAFPKVFQEAERQGPNSITDLLTAILSVHRSLCTAAMHRHECMLCRKRGRGRCRRRSTTSVARASSPSGTSNRCNSCNHMFSIIRATLNPHASRATALSKIGIRPRAVTRTNLYCRTVQEYWLAVLLMYLGEAELTVYDVFRSKLTQEWRVIHTTISGTIRMYSEPRG